MGGTSARLHLHPSFRRSLISSLFETPDPAKLLCLFTDASSTHWVGALRQVDCAEIAQYAVLPLERNHSPVAFVSGFISRTLFSLNAPEQESYAIVASVTRLSHILAACGEFSLFTDHKNILYVLSPTRFTPTSPDTSFTRRSVGRYDSPSSTSPWNIFLEHSIPGPTSSLAGRLLELRDPCTTSERPSSASHHRIPSIAAIS